MNKNTSENLAYAVAMLQAFLGAGLFVAPWLFGFAGEGISAWMAWATGAAFAVIGLLNFDEDSSWPAWANMVAGLWAVIAPWATQFAAVEAAMWSHVIVGVVVIATSLAKLYGGHNWTPRVPA